MFAAFGCLLMFAALQMSLGKLVFRCHQVSCSSDVFADAAFRCLQVSRSSDVKSAGVLHRCRI